MSGDKESTHRAQFTLAVKCHWCGHKGLSVWEETEAGRELVSIDGFYQRLKSLRPYKIETVCNSCDKTQPL